MASFSSSLNGRLAPFAMRAPLRHGTTRSAFRAPGPAGARRLRRLPGPRVLLVALPLLILLGVALWGLLLRKAVRSQAAPRAGTGVEPREVPLRAKAQVAAAVADTQTGSGSEPLTPAAVSASKPQSIAGLGQPQGLPRPQAQEGTLGQGAQGQGAAAVVSEVQALVEGDRKRMRAHIERETQQPQGDPAAVARPAQGRAEAAGSGWQALPWLPVVRRWLRENPGREGAPWTPAHVVACEEFFQRSGGCGNNCNGRGVCNERRGVCHCHMGYTGPDCAELEDFPCNNPETPDMPIGFWVHSMCAAACDRRTGRCLCGSATPFPSRPAPFPCGLTKKPNGEIEWRIPERASLYSNETGKPGWCHAAPDDMQAGRAQATCQCMYDGAEGVACEHRVEAYCVNQCSERGACVNAGFCQCDEGWYGIDCSIPTASQALKILPLKGGPGAGGAGQPGTVVPAWLQGGAQGGCPAAETEGDRPELARQGHTTVLRAKLRKKPLVYIYDMPPNFTVMQLQARTWKGQCVRRLYGGANETRYQFGQLYGAELAVLEGLLASEHRTLDAEAADYFYVPVFGQCIAERGPDDSPAMNMKHVENVRVHYAAEVYREAQRYVAAQFPFFNRSGGRDHMWFFGWDEGACTAPSDIWPGVMLSHWGNTGHPHTGSQSQYGHDIWNRTMGPDIRNPAQPCFDPAKDVVMPAWTTFLTLNSPSVQRPVGERKVLFYFTGNLGNAFDPGRPEQGYSMGIRQRVGELFSSTRNVNGSLGRLWEEGVVVSHRHSGSYGEELADAQFCGVFPGDGFSARMEAAMLHGCIPVIVQDGIQLTFENYLDFSAFAVRVAEAELPSMLTILKAIPMERRAEMQRHVLRLRLRWTYHSVDRLELQRQQRLGRPLLDPWLQILQGVDAAQDDAMDTLFQILAYKREQETWRTD